MPNITLSQGPASLRTHSGTMPGQQLSTGPCSLPAGQPPRPHQNPSVILETLAAALPYALSQTQSGPSPGLGSTGTVGKFGHHRNSLRGARGHLPILSLPLLSSARQSHVLTHFPPFLPCSLPSLLLSTHAGPPTAWRQADSPTQGGLGAR